MRPPGLSGGLQWDGSRHPCGPRPRNCPAEEQSPSRMGETGMGSGGSKLPLTMNKVIYAQKSLPWTIEGSYWQTLTETSAGSDVPPSWVVPGQRPAPPPFPWAQGWVPACPLGMERAKVTRAPNGSATSPQSRLCAPSRLFPLVCDLGKGLSSGQNSSHPKLQQLQKPKGPDNCPGHQLGQVSLPVPSLPSTSGQMWRLGPGAASGSPGPLRTPHFFSSFGKAAS